MSGCYYCAEAFPSEPIGRTDECRRCHRPLHVCRNCLFYDERAADCCRESAADPEPDKERANFCDRFRLGTFAAGTKNIGGESAKNRFEALFHREKP